MISGILLNWYEANKRDLPWRNTESPYKIWLSEIILQQTRVNQGLGYYERFVEKYPDIKDLAEAPLDDVLKMWQGLGYYTRARNLHETANLIVRDHGGVFPDTFDQLKGLKGIGNYTAAAVASFAFKKPVALVDGNVYRVISRLFDNHTPINTSAGKKIFMKLADELLDHGRPDVYNQALMEFGALVCLPRNPQCQSCVLSIHCLARARATVAVLPVKKYRAQGRIRYLNYLYIKYDGITWLKKRTESDIWNSLYEFPLVETDDVDFGQLISIFPWNRFFTPGINFRVEDTITYKHKLSHQLLICRFFRVWFGTTPGDTTGYFPVKLSEIRKYAVPRVIDRYLEENQRDWNS